MNINIRRRKQEVQRFVAAERQGAEKRGEAEGIGCVDICAILEEGVRTFERATAVDYAAGDNGGLVGYVSVEDGALVAGCEGLVVDASAQKVGRGDGVKAFVREGERNYIRETGKR